jgi:hypothetical protein
LLVVHAEIAAFLEDIRQERVIINVIILLSEFILKQVLYTLVG